ncbi:DUF551 domain-containing protein [Klebsiella pneumoniae]|uniref:DUF551 domain-containing protein n=1 Tax=Klebsiella pneumoniae TaxID=573 RepID=UPI0027B88E86|nr:DUF551 domain-containing protein [Klebsiella pneumoniae]
MDSEPVEMPLDYLQGHKDGLEWASQLAEANHPETGDWLYDDPIELAKAIRKGSDMPPAQPAADSEPVAWTWQHLKQWHVTNDEERARDLAWDGVKVEPLYRRAAMLQAGTLTNEGTKQAWTGIPDIDNAINMLDRIDTLDSCDDDRIEAVKTVLRGLAGNSPMWVGVDWAKGCELGNSPVIPDGSASMLRRWLAFGRGMQNAGSQLPHNLIAETESMLAAAPQSPGSDPATVPGKWIPVSEQMPEDDGAYLCWDNRYVTTHAFIFGAWQANQFIAKNITHWMPLPAAPQEVSDA